MPIQTGSDMVEVDFIVVDTYSPYTVIVARPWLHALRAVSSTLHQKVEYPSEGQVKDYGESNHGQIVHSGSYLMPTQC